MSQPGVVLSGGCRHCRNAYQQAHRHVIDRRYAVSDKGVAKNLRWRQSIRGQLSRETFEVRRRIKRNTIRVSELEALLNANT